MLILNNWTVRCPVGMEYLPTNDTCQLCRIGFYKDVIGSHVDCLPCPVNYTTRSEGTVSPQDCKLGNVSFVLQNVILW